VFFQARGVRLGGVTFQELAQRRGAGTGGRRHGTLLTEFLPKQQSRILHLTGLGRKE
jgi:hypothetical protein